MLHLILRRICLGGMEPSKSFSPSNVWHADHGAKG